MLMNAVAHIQIYIRYTDTVAQFNKNPHTDPNLSWWNTQPDTHTRARLLHDNKTGALHTSFLVLAARAAAQSLRPYYPPSALSLYMALGPQNSGACNSCSWRPKKPREEIEFQGRAWMMASERRGGRFAAPLCERAGMKGIHLSHSFSSPFFAAIFLIHAQSSSPLRL